VDGFHSAARAGFSTYYYFFVDGVQVNDPPAMPLRGEQGFDGHRSPGKGVDCYDGQERAAGEGGQQLVFSRSPSWRAAWLTHRPITTPTRAPATVLYLQHGAGEDETGWTRRGASTSSWTT